MLVLFSIPVAGIVLYPHRAFELGAVILEERGTALERDAVDRATPRRWRSARWSPRGERCG